MTTDAPTTTAAPTTIEAPTTTDANSPGSGTVSLSIDGLGPHTFGERQSVVEATLTQSLGPPEVADQLQPAPVFTCIRWGCSNSAVLYWPAAGLLAAFSDRTRDGEQLQEAAFVAWTLTSTTPWRPGDIYVPDAAPSAPAPTPETRLTLDNDIGLGSNLSELRSAYPSTADKWWNETSFVPTGFYVPGSDGSTNLQGDLDWNVVVTLQAALVANGASISVDGIAGPDTTAAFTAYRERTGFVDPIAAFEALGINGPELGTRLIRLSAGDWFWELSCGGLEPFGIPSGC